VPELHPIRILFVCLGNICRSPMAEAIMRHKAQGKKGIEIDSAGTGDWHTGENPDPRTVAVLLRHGIQEYSRARQLRTSDFEEFDYIIGMDAANVKDILAWRGARPGKVSLAATWQDPASTAPVPDPYYGSMGDFKRVYDQLDEITDAILRKIDLKVEL
jgi:protein-tyrosine phosphatase